MPRSIRIESYENITRVPLHHRMARVIRLVRVVKVFRWLRKSGWSG